jgi:predicted hotdog family 3-hydroxylacyl-ACP dehydratase
MRAIEDISLKELIPQRPPFVMIDRLVSCDMVFTVTEFEVREDNIFVVDGHLTAEGLMENIAQTCAARMGYINLCKGDTVKIGVIGAVNRLDILRTPKVGERIVTTIEVLEEMFQITMVRATVKLGEQTLAEANMKIAIMDVDSQD